MDAQVNLPARCYSYAMQEAMTVFEVEHPFKESAGFFAQLFDLDVAESVLMAVAQEASEDYAGFYVQRPMLPEESEGAPLVVSFDGKGVPMIKEEEVKPKAKLGTGEKRQRGDVADDAPRAQQVRRLASLVQTKQAVMERMRFSLKLPLSSCAGCHQAPRPVRACAARPAEHSAGRQGDTSGVMRSGEKAV